MVIIEIVVVFILILLNGFLAMSELAMVSARKARLMRLSREGRRGAGRAISVIENPGRFLSTVQIGITLIGVLAGAFSGATLAEDLAVFLEGQGLAPATADTIAFAIVVAAITYISLIIGELVPKQIALANPERVASTVARPMAALTVIVSPAVWLLDQSSRLVLRMIRPKNDGELRVSEDEIKAMIAEAEAVGLVEPEETLMLSRVMRLGDRAVRAVMTPRPEVDWIDLTADEDEIRQRLLETRHSCLPACRGTIDDVVGIVYVKDLLDGYLVGRTAKLSDLVRQTTALPDSAQVLDAIEMLKKGNIHMALVVDEYGSFQGVVTATDALEAIVGAFEGPVGTVEAPAVQRDDGSWLFDGTMSSDQMTEILETPQTSTDDVHSVAGFVLSHMRRLPTTGDSFEWNGWRFEVVDMDGRRIDKVLASRVPVPQRKPSLRGL
jgi:putative hemolysin